MIVSYLGETLGMLLEDQLAPNRATVPQINRLDACSETQSDDRLIFCKLCHYKYEVSHSCWYMRWDLCSTSCKFYMCSAAVRALLLAAPAS